MQVQLPGTAPKAAEVGGEHALRQGAFGSGLCWHKPALLYRVTALAAHPVPLRMLLPLKWGKTYVCSSFPHPVTRPGAVALRLETLGQHAANL